MKTIFNTLDNSSSNLVALLCVIASILIAALGLVVNNISLIEPLFFLPIVIISWYGDKKTGLVITTCSVSILFITKILIEEIATFSLGHLIYFAVRFVTYYLVTVLIIDYRTAHNQELNLANKDYLTGLLNTRSFSIELANEILRSIRYQHQFSLAYLDVDDFKVVNDTRGHNEGDRVLKSIAKSLTSSLRNSDLTARLGGDEFAIIFPETDENEVKFAFEKTMQALENEPSIKKLKLTFSVGVVTFKDLPNDIKQAIDIADQLMYSVKATKKNGIAYKVWHHNQQ